MLRTITYIFCFSICLASFSCSSDSPSENTTVVQTDTKPGERRKVKYPDFFKELGVPQAKDAFVMNTKKLPNSKGKYGTQTREETSDDFESAKAFFLSQLEQNDWKRDTKRDKKSTPEQENDEVPVKYFVTNFQKDKYLLMLNITATNNERTIVTKILKEI